MCWRSLAEWFGFQLVWLMCALGAAEGRTAPGCVAAAIFVCAVLASKRWSSSECLIILASGVAGLLVESLFVTMGMIRFAAPWPNLHLAPAWIVALWCAFGATLTTLASWLGDRFVIKAMSVAFVAGPLTYWAGERLAALEIVGSAPLTYLAIALIWAMTLLILLTVRRRLPK